MCNSASRMFSYGFVRAAGGRARSTPRCERGRRRGAGRAGGMHAPRTQKLRLALRYALRVASARPHTLPSQQQGDPEGQRATPVPFAPVAVLAAWVGQGGRRAAGGAREPCQARAAVGECASGVEPVQRGGGGQRQPAGRSSGARRGRAPARGVGGARGPGHVAAVLPQRRGRYEPVGGTRGVCGLRRGRRRRRRGLGAAEDHGDLGGVRGRCDGRRVLCGPVERRDDLDCALRGAHVLPGAARGAADVQPLRTRDAAPARDMWLVGAADRRAHAARVLREREHGGVILDAAARLGAGRRGRPAARAVRRVERDARLGLAAGAVARILFLHAARRVAGGEGCALPACHARGTDASPVVCSSTSSPR